MSYSSLSITRWAPNAKDALASGVTQMQHVMDLARGTMRGVRVNEQEALMAVCLAVAGATQYHLDLTSKFERVDAVFAYNKTTSAAVNDTQVQVDRAILVVTDLIITGAPEDSDGNWTFREADRNTKPGYNLLGEDTDDDASAITWNGLSEDEWTISDADDNIMYSSDEDVATPDLVEEWVAVDGDGDPIVTPNPQYAAPVPGKVLLTLTASTNDIILITVVGKLKPSI